MQDHTVNIDRSVTPSVISFSPIFNVATAFIDRHLDEGRGDRIAIRTDREEVSYQALYENVNRYGNALKALGLNEGDRILMAVFDEPAFFYTFWGAIKAGFVPIPVNTILKAPEYRFLIENSECHAVVYSADLEGQFKEAVTGEMAGLHVLSTGEGGLAGLAADQPAELSPARTGPETECFWLYSSGSTGAPKGVVHAHKDMVITSERYGQGIAGIRPEDTVYCVGKLFFSYGFGGGMTFPLWAGATTVLVREKTTPELVFSVVDRFRPDVFFGVPTLYGQMLHAAPMFNPDMSSIRIALSAGEALPAHVFEKVQENFGFIILDGIGSSEVLHIFISNRADDIRPGTSGKPVAGYEVKIVDENKEEIEPGEIGTLWVKGESIATRYWNNPEKTARTMLGEWLNTGDMYYVDSDGYYVNAGRDDDMLKVGGMWCSPIEIEAHLLRHPNVREVAVVGRKDEDSMIKPEAFVVLKEANDPDEKIAEDMKQFCKKGLAGYKYPRWFNFVEDLPKTTTGKIQRFRLRGDR